jgi:hypothetical protein
MNVHANWLSEIFFSYFRDIDKIQKNFQNDIKEIYNKEYLDKMESAIGNGVVPESKYALVINKVIVILEEIYLAVLEKYINRKSSIYLTINKKMEILKKTFVNEN